MAGKMVHWLGAHTALAEDPNLTVRTHVGSSQPLLTPDLADLTPSSVFRGYLHSHAHALTQTHRRIHN